MVSLTWDFNLYMHLFNGIIGILALISGFYMYKYHISIFVSWPRNQRFFMLYFCFLTALFLAANSVAVSTIAILTNNAKPGGRKGKKCPKPIIYHVFRLMLIVSCQQLRFSYFIIIMERMVATIYLEQYAKFSTAVKFFGIFIILSIFGQLICTFTSFLTFFEILPPTYLNGGYENIIWVAFIMHAITLICCKFLYDKNQQMYKLLAYQCTLQQRHQTVENIKMLSLLWPAVLVFSIISPLGPASTLLFTVITNNMGPIGLFHITYNFTPIIMALYSKFYSKRKNDVHPSVSVIKENQLVISPLGAILPTHVSQENYFKELRNLWN